MMRSFAVRCRSRVGRACLALTLLMLPACGLSDYESLALQAQEREERFREEKRLLDEPVKIPTHKDKDDHDVALADMFFRPPKGIQAVYQPEKRDDLLWQYFPARTGSDFARVEIAFAEDNKEFAAEVLPHFQASGPSQQRVDTLTPPGRPQLEFAVWEFDNVQEGYSINVLRGQPQVAIVYVYNPTRRASLKRAMQSVSGIAGPRLASGGGPHEVQAKVALAIEGRSPRPVNGDDGPPLTCWGRASARNSRR